MAVKHKRKQWSPIETAAKTLEQCLVGENVDQLLATLSATEREFLENMAKEIREGGQSPQLEQLWKFDYTRKPPGIQEFVDDDYWLGHVTRPSAENPGLWPTWREILLRDFDLDSRIHNCVITGSLGIGKTWNMVLIILYRLVLASLLRNPYNFLGLSVGSKIIYVLVSVTRAQVQDTAFGVARDMMSKSPYFLEEMHFNPDSKYSGQVIDLGRGIQLNAGSKGQHMIGRNTPAIGMDEGNFRLEANPDVKAFKLFNEIRTRIKNRFQKVAGFLPAISIIASSASDESSFTETVIAEIQKKGDPKTEVVYSNPVYYMKNCKVWKRLGADPNIIEQHANKYRPRWFKVAYGLKNVSPSILSGWYDADGRPIDQDKHESPPIGSKLELVPEDYSAEFDRDVIGALQSLSGISIGGSYRLFTSTIDLEWCVTEGERLGVTNPCTVVQIPVSEEDDREVWDYLDHPKFLLRQGGSIKPRRHPNALRFAHMDLATRTMAGLAICHMIGWKEVQDAVDRTTGSVFSEHRLVVEYDFILTIVSGRVKPISFEKIQKFFIWLREKCGYNFGLITADTFQSFMQLQMLETRNFRTGSLSVDKTKSPYYAFRSGIEERRVLLYRQPWMMAEAEKLIDGPKMVDHPEEGDVHCLRGSTKLRLANGMSISLSAMVRRPKDRYVMAYNLGTRKEEVALATNPRVSGFTHQFFQVRLNTGYGIDCTPEHKFLLESGEWTQAKELKVGSKLMATIDKIVFVARVGYLPYMEEAEPVYDVTVPGLANFVLNCGVVAHNSKDTIDGVAGAYWDCINNPTDNTDALSNTAIMPDGELESQLADKPPISIELPPWRRKTRTFVSKS